jgi:hypothetical protein
MQQQYTIQFNYPVDMESYLCDTYTFTANVQLYIKGIEAHQVNDRCLVVECDRMLTWALLVLASIESNYTVSVV